MNTLDKSESPLVSVIMPVYNAAPYLRLAIESILNQKYANIEFIIINDGSTDNSVSIIESYGDKRIKFIDFKSNKGIEERLNYGCHIAQGLYIARMDADDISLSNRLALQVMFLNKHQDIMLVGTDLLLFKQQRVVGYRTYFNKNEYLKIRALFSSPLAHATIVFRKQLIELGIKYKNGYRYAEDFKLFNDILKDHKVANICIPLYLYRQFPKRTSPTYKQILKNSLQKIFIEQFNNTSWKINQENLEAHYQLATSNLKQVYALKRTDQIEKWILNILEQNEITKHFDSFFLKQYMGLLYIRLVIKHYPYKIFKLRQFSINLISSLKILNYLIVFYTKKVYYSIYYNYLNPFRWLKNR